jgi:hypothetical protein
MLTLQKTILANPTSQNLPSTMAESPTTLIVGSKTDLGNLYRNFPSTKAHSSPMPVDLLLKNIESVDAHSLYDAEFPNGHKLLFTSGNGKLCGFNAVIKSAAEQGIEPPPTLEVLQGIAKSSEYLAHILSHSPDPENVAIAENNFTQEELGLVVQFYGDSINQPLQLAVGKSPYSYLTFHKLTYLTVVKDKVGEGVSYCITPHPHPEHAKSLWVHCDNAEDDTHGILGHWSALKKDHARRIRGHADPKLPPPDTLVKIGSAQKGERVTWVRAQIWAEEAGTGKEKMYPFRSDRGEGGISLKLKRLGGELYPHLLLEAKIDTVLEIDGEKTKKTLSLATAKFFLDKPNNFDHAEKIEIGPPEPDRKFPERGTIRFSFWSRSGATTQRCDVVEPEWDEETKIVLGLMLSMQTPGKVDLTLHYHNKKILTALQAVLDDFKVSRRHNYSPYLFMKRRTPAIIFGSHKCRADVTGTNMHDGRDYVPEIVPPVLAYRDTVEMEVKHGISGIIEWEYQRSLFESLGTVEHQAQFQILGKDTVLVHLRLASILKIDDLIFDENVVLEVSWPPSGPNQDKRQSCSAIIQDGYTTSSNRRDTITLLALGDSALKFQYVGAIDINKATVINHVRVVAKFESKQLTEDCLALRKFSQYGQKYHKFFLNKAATIGTRSDPTTNCGLPKGEVDMILEDVIKIAGLNHGQIEAVKACRNLLDLFMLIWGPPGTGKTYTAAAFICFLLQCGVFVMALAPSNPAANQLLTSIIDMQAKLEQGGRTIMDFERPLMINRSTAEISQLYRYGQDERPEPELDEHQQARVLTWEQQAAKLVTEIAMYTDVKLRRRLRAMEHPEHSVTAAVIKLAQAGTVQVHAHWPGEKEDDATVDMAAELKMYLEKLTKERFADWEKEDKKKFTVSFAEVRDQVIRGKHCLALTFASTYGDILKPFAGGLAVQGPPIVLVLDEQSLTPEVRTILACVAPQCWKRIVGCIILGDHEQLPVLLLSKDFNEFFMQAELCTYERKMRAGFPGKQLFECERLHPKLLDYPSRKKYGGALVPTASASNRQFHPGYIKSCKEYFEENDESKLHLYAVDIADSKSYTSAYSKSRSNLHTAHEIGNFLMKVRRDVKPSDFSLSENMVILAGHKDQVRTINRLLIKKISQYNANVEDAAQRFSRSEFPTTFTIDAFMGRDSLIVLWDHVISHANKSSDVGFLKDDRRVNVACTRAKLQLIKFTRLEMLEERFFAAQTGREMDWETQEQVLKEKFYISEYLGEMVHEELYVCKEVKVAIEEIVEHETWVGDVEELPSDEDESTQAEGDEGKITDDVKEGYETADEDEAEEGVESKEESEQKGCDETWEAITYTPPVSFEFFEHLHCQLT